MTTRRQRVLDVIERVIWTVLQVGAGEAIVLSFDIPQIWVAPIAGLLAAVKGALATKYGDGTAATLPAGRHRA